MAPVEIVDLPIKKQVDLSMFFCMELPEASRFMPQLATGVPAVPRPHPKQPRDPRHEQKTKDRKNRRP